MVHVADMVTSPACNGFNCEGAWLDRLELSPNDSWETIQTKSAAWMNDPMWLPYVD
jgi:hypothetical protein